MIVLNNIFHINIRKIKLIIINLLLFRTNAFAFINAPKIEYSPIYNILWLVIHYLLIVFFISLIIYYFIDKNILFRMKIRWLIIIQLKIILGYLIYWCLEFIYTIIVYKNINSIDSINTIIQANYEFGILIIFFKLFMEPIKTISFLVISTFIVKLIKIKN